MAGAPFTMEVELGKIREFARATKSSNPDYLKADTPVSPATFLASSAFWTGPENSPPLEEIGDVARILHGEQEFTFQGEPPRAGTRLVGQTRIAATYEKQGKRGGSMRFVELVTEFRTPEGRLVAESKSTAIVTGQAPEEGSATS
ncbi:MaoC family dehydratase N-terminal domain-containing protein [Frankia sp. Cppng1_Ct_nod]|uniref:FAS1-like dehydratase domain-containing protein n=1 Tax=Frankia sp. Cppng1_Ct_nod TaxID=2897162 RepID=UPI0010418781|nr:MaoC family dehydratase N-terminal domain-containing protein [Frankia sp. Cppng1_Ct_nod]